MIFGSYNVPGLPQDIVGWLLQYKEQGHEFIVGDNKGFECSVHKTLSSIGAIDQSTIYCMGEPKNNSYGIKAKIFDTFFDEDSKSVLISARDKSSEDTSEDFVINGVEKEEDIIYNRDWYEFRDRQMIEDCAMAICLWDGETKNTFNNIQLLGIKNKPCHVIKMY